MNDKSLIQAARALLDEQMRASLTDPMLTLNEMALAGEDIKVSATLLRNLFAALVAAPSAAQAQPVADGEPSAREQKLAERVDWTTKQWYEHVGARENDQDEIVFGTVMALRAMMVQFREVSLFAADKRAATDAAPVEAKPFMYAIMEPAGAPYLDEFCVATNAEDLHSTLNGLNDSPDAGYTIVPVYTAAPPSPAQGDALPQQALALEQAAKACDQQADGTNGPYRTACLQCADAVRALHDSALAAKPAEAA